MTGSVHAVCVCVRSRCAAVAGPAGTSMASPTTPANIALWTKGAQEQTATTSVFCAPHAALSPLPRRLHERAAESAPEQRTSRITMRCVDSEPQQSHGPQAIRRGRGGWREGSRRPGILLLLSFFGASVSEAVVLDERSPAWTTASSNETHAEDPGNRTEPVAGTCPSLKQRSARRAVGACDRSMPVGA